MSAFLRRLHFAWEYFVWGKHRSPSKGTAPAPAEDWRKNLEWHESPLVGRYVRTKFDTWWTDTVLKNLGYELRLIAPGPDPTAAQMADFETLVARLPELITAADLETIPDDDGWGNKPPPFDILCARVESITMKADGSYWMSFDVESDGIYMLAPSFTIAPDHTLIEAEWSV